jgi:hypothetical protein
MTRTRMLLVLLALAGAAVTSSCIAWSDLDPTVVDAGGQRDAGTVDGGTGASAEDWTCVSTAGECAQVERPPQPFEQTALVALGDDLLQARPGKLIHYVAGAPGTDGHGLVTPDSTREVITSSGSCGATPENGFDFDGFSLDVADGHLVALSIVGGFCVVDLNAGHACRCVITAPPADPNDPLPPYRTSVKFVEINQLVVVTGTCGKDSTACDKPPIASLYSVGDSVTNAPLLLKTQVVLPNVTTSSGSLLSLDPPSRSTGAWTLLYANREHRDVVQSDGVALTLTVVPLLDASDTTSTVAVRNDVVTLLGLTSVGHFTEATLNIPRVSVNVERNVQVPLSRDELILAAAASDGGKAAFVGASGLVVVDDQQNTQAFPASVTRFDTVRFVSSTPQAGHENDLVWGVGRGVLAVWTNLSAKGADAVLEGVDVFLASCALDDHSILLGGGGDAFFRSSFTTDTGITTPDLVVDRTTTAIDMHTTANGFKTLNLTQDNALQLEDYQLPGGFTGVIAPLSIVNPLAAVFDPFGADPRVFAVALTVPAGPNGPSLDVITCTQDGACSTHLAIALAPDAVSNVVQLRLDAHNLIVVAQNGIAVLPLDENRTPIPAAAHVVPITGSGFDTAPLRDGGNAVVVGNCVVTTAPYVPSLLSRNFSGTGGSTLHNLPVLGDIVSFGDAGDVLVDALGGMLLTGHVNATTCALEDLHLLGPARSNTDLVTAAFGGEQLYVADVRGLVWSVPAPSAP